LPLILLLLLLLLRLAINGSSSSTIHRPISWGCVVTILSVILLWVTNHTSNGDGSASHINWWLLLLLLAAVVVVHHKILRAFMRFV
jgi:hypothetical protein